MNNTLQKLHSIDLFFKTWNTFIHCLKENYKNNQATDVTI